MNIFFLDTDPKKCAEYHNDKHVVKMILETAQLLCGAHWSTGSSAPYKLTHEYHPCSIWTRSDINNYIWLCNLGLHLCTEYNLRYGKTHKTREVILWCCDNHPILPDIRGSYPPMAMPDHCKKGNNVVMSYRNYYMTEKRNICKWKNKKEPYWFS